LRSKLEAHSRLYRRISWTQHDLHAAFGREILSDFHLDLSDSRLRFNRSSAQTVFALEGDERYLAAFQLLYARDCGIIDSLPSFSEDELSDKRKGDTLVKTLAQVQVIWLIGQLATRGALGKPSAPLETMTLAFAGALSSFACYSCTIINAWKPQSILRHNAARASKRSQQWHAFDQRTFESSELRHLIFRTLIIMSSFSSMVGEPQPSFSYLVPAAAPCSSAAFPYPDRFQDNANTTGISPNCSDHVYRRNISQYVQKDSIILPSPQ
jgi:hypothetical protein